MGGRLGNRRLGDLTVRDVVKGLVAWRVVAVVASLIAGGVALALWEPGSGSFGEYGVGSGAAIPSAGTVITQAEFQTVRVGDARAAVLERLGPPAGTEAPQAMIDPQQYGDCAVYRRAGRPADEFVICFEDGRVFETTAF